MPGDLARVDGESRLPETGWYGEQIAARWLEARGLEILDRNWRCGRYEIDLIARDREVIAFVEVKTRRLGPGPRPSSSIDAAKRGRLIRAAAAWISTRGTVGREFRFDICEVIVAAGGMPLVEHTMDAFHADGS